MPDDMVEVALPQVPNHEVPTQRVVPGMPDSGLIRRNDNQSPFQEKPLVGVDLREPIGRITGTAAKILMPAPVNAKMYLSTQSWAESTAVAAGVGVKLGGYEALLNGRTVEGAAKLMVGGAVEYFADRSVSKRAQESGLQYNTLEDSPAVVGKKAGEIVAQVLLPGVFSGREMGTRTLRVFRDFSATLLEPGLVSAAVLTGQDPQTVLEVYMAGRAATLSTEGVDYAFTLTKEFIGKVADKAKTAYRKKEVTERTEVLNPIQEEPQGEPSLPSSSQFTTEISRVSSDVNNAEQQTRERFIAKIEGGSVVQESPSEPNEETTSSWVANDFIDINRKPITDDEAEMYLQRNAQYLTPEMRRLAVNSINQDHAIPVAVQESVRDNRMLQDHEFKGAIEERKIQEGDAEREDVIDKAVKAGDSDAASLAYLGGPERKLTDNEKIDAELEGSRYPDGSEIPQEKKEEARKAINTIRNWGDNRISDTGAKLNPFTDLTKEVKENLFNAPVEREIELFISEHHLNSEEAERARALRKSGARLSLESIRGQNPIISSAPEQPRSIQTQSVDTDTSQVEPSITKTPNFLDRLKGWIKENIRTEGNGLPIQAAQESVPEHTKEELFSKEKQSSDSLLKAPGDLVYDRSEVKAAAEAKANGAQSIFTRLDEGNKKDTGAMPLDEDQFSIWRERAETKGIYTADQLREVESTYRKTRRVPNEVYWPVIPHKDEQREQSSIKNEEYNSKALEQLRNRVIDENEFRMRVLQDYPSAEATIAATALWKQSGRMPTGIEVKAYLESHRADISAQVSKWDDKKQNLQQREVGVSNGQ